jgi:hypothetical protein
MPRRPRSLSSAVDHCWKIHYYSGHEIEQVLSFRYVGLELHQSGSFIIAATLSLESARTATFGLHSRCDALHIRDPKLKCKLFDALICPVYNYGCEVWSIDKRDGRGHGEVDPQVYANHAQIALTRCYINGFWQAGQDATSPSMV